jgi:hypothetical protein
MPTIIAWFLEKITVGVVFKGLYYTALVAFVLAWGAFILYVFGLVGDLYNWINQALSMFSSGGGAEILGLLTCLGVVDGINAGLPVFLTVLSAVVVINISKFFYDYAVKIFQFLGNLS